MKRISIAELRYTNVDLEITDIFLERWIHRKDFSLYKAKARPCNALFFVCADMEVTFFPKDAAAVTAKKGDVVFIPQGIFYHVRTSGNETSNVHTYTINYRLFDEGREELSLSDRVSVLTNRQDHLLDVHLKKLCDTFHRLEENTIGEKQNLVRIKGEFFLLLDLIAESVLQSRDVYYPIRKGIDAFCDEWNQNERIEKYAKLCGISVTYFYRCFRKWSGKSPVEYRNMLRLSNAESLLRCTDMQIGEISEAVGFEDPFYFCRIFGQKFGVSPQKYRKRAQQ